MIGVTILYGLGLAYVVYWARGVFRERRDASTRGPAAAGFAEPHPSDAQSTGPPLIAAESTSPSMSWSAVDDRQLARYIDGLPPLR